MADRYISLVPGKYNFFISNDVKKAGERCMSCRHIPFELVTDNLIMSIDSSDVEDLRKNGWPRILGSNRQIAVSEEVVEWLRREKIDGFTSHPLTLTKEGGEILCDVQYHVLDARHNINGRINDASVEVCRVCGISTALSIAQKDISLIGDPTATHVKGNVFRIPNIHPSYLFVSMEIGKRMVKRWGDELSLHRPVIFFG